MIESPLVLLARCRERLVEGNVPRRPLRDPREHLREAVDWIRRAQDASPDGGVSHSYAIGKGWAPSYPETTGYIIPSFLATGRFFPDPDCRARALRMAEWELLTQLSGGGIPDLIDGSPRVFDTGQVIFGLLAAFEESGEEKFLEGARRAGRWLVERMAGRETWRENGTRHCYHSRAAWALVRLAGATGDGAAEETARRSLEWTLTQERSDGWFDNNCLNDADRPLLHTIAYTAQGLAECGFHLGETRYVAAARRTMRALAAAVDESGRMAGRFGFGWQPAARWCCLTGMAQSVVVWARLDHCETGRGFERERGLVLGFLKRTQDMESAHPGLRGGIRGSYPVQGDYGRYRVLNWATKFYIDALLCELLGERSPVPC